MTNENLEHAFDTFTPGSTGFCNYVATHCDGLGLSVTEIERICAVAPNVSAFLRVWQDSDFWTDENNAA
jgi:hypothetical protein